jgi:prepilin-type N-terminal cleavage/methylation domain-containing protein
MRRGERGFTLIEVLVVIAIVALITTAATMSTFQVFNVTRRSNDHVVTVRQVQNAGYWISRDALMAESVVVDEDPETDEFLTLKWTEWGYDAASTYHSVTYSIEVLPDEIPKIWREHSTYAPGVEPESETNLVAEYIDYDPSMGFDGPTWADYENPPVLTVQITSSLREASETREYRVLPRPDF